VVLTLSGPRVEVMDAESGGHRLQRVPPTERRGRVHSSTVTVAVMDPVTIASQPFLETDVTIDWFGGTTGAGGQHRNKHQNSARLLHRPTGIVRTAQTRSRKASLAAAMTALREAVEFQQQSMAADRSNTDRRGQIGSAVKADKRRTYRFQDGGKVIDHQTGRQARLDDVMAGRFELLH
jgi:peptide chain release factor 1